MVAAFCDDGYTIDGFIKEDPGVHPAVRFKYRPFTPEDRSVLYDGDWDSLSLAEQGEKVYATLAKHVKSWDVKDSKGKAVPCMDPKSYRKFLAFDRLREIVIFRSGKSDRDPDADKTEAPSGEGHAAEGEKN